MPDPKDFPLTVYSPESQLRTPRRLLSAMWQGFLHSRDLGWRLFVRDIAAQYRQSFFGIFWAFFPPIIMGLVFILLHSQKIVNFNETHVPYPVFVLIGTTLWQVFVVSLNAPLRSIGNSKSLLAKIYFPWEALMLAAFYDTIFNLLFKILVLVGVFVFFKVPVGPGLLAVPLGLLMLVFLGMTIGVYFAILGMVYSDFIALLNLVSSLWFFFTPVIYPPPASFPFSLVNVLNPVTPILEGTRALMTGTGLPNAVPCLFVFLLTFFGFFMAWVLYRVAIPIMVERMPNA